MKTTSLSRKHRPVALGLVLSLFVALAAVSAGASAYPGARTLSTLGGPTAVVVDRVNSDTVLDLVSNAPGVGRIALYIGDGNGGFLSSLAWKVDGTPGTVATVDFDRDGLKDIAWVDSASGLVGLLRQVPGGVMTFQRQSVPGPDEATDLVVVDREGDGWPDLLVSHRGADVLAWYGNTLGTLGASDPFAVGDSPTELALLSHPAGKTIAVLQNGYLSRDVLLFGLPRPSSELRLPVESDRGIEAIDMDLDGDDEIVVLESSPARLIWFEGQGANFQVAGEIPIEPRSTAVRVFPEDISPRRLIVAEERRQRVTLWLDSGTGFVETGNWYVGAVSGDLLVADVDGDGASEVVIPRSDKDVLSINEPLGNGLLAPWALDTGLDPIRLERYDVGGGEEFMAALCPGSNEIWIYRIVGGRVELVDITPADDDTRELVLADIDGNGAVDVVSASFTAGVWISRGIVGGGFLPTEFLSIGTAPIDLELADVVGDASLDLIIADRNLPGLHVYAGDGAGGFTASTTVMTAQIPAGVVAEDLDLNGHTDLVVLGETDEIYLVFNSPGSALIGVPLTVGDQPRDIGFGNFNEDIYPDIVVANAGSGTYAMVMSVLPAFYSVIARERETFSGAQNVEIMDVDVDGLDDVLFSSPSFDTAALHYNTGSGGRPSEPAAVSQLINVSDAPRDIRLAYIDGDSIPDLMTINFTGDILYVSRSDPFEDVPQATATMELTWAGDDVTIDVFASVQWAHDLEVRAVEDDRLLALERVGDGHWRAVDRVPPNAAPSYSVSDRRGAELDRKTAIASEPVTAVEVDDIRWLDPTVQGRSAEFRMRAPLGIRPDLKIYDVRGRRVAQPEIIPEGDRWFRASWSGTDMRGRPISRGRYLVRVTMGGHVLRGSVLLR